MSFSFRDQFWDAVAKERILFREPHHTVSDCNFAQGRINWFLGGKLNVSENCLDRHLATKGDSPAIIWERDEPGQSEVVSYRALHEMTCRIANVLKSHGIRKGDRVGVYMPMCPTAAAVMLACARIGAVHNVVFAGFSSEALAKRLEQSEAKAVFTADRGLRGGKFIPLKSVVDEAVKLSPSVEKVFVMDRTGDESAVVGDKDVALEKEMSQASPDCPPEVLDSEDPLFMLYTSGSTGAPKGLIHTQAGYLTYASLTHELVFDYKPGDVYACVADVGWITGHTYTVYGPLANGATTVMFESIPTYPDPGRYWEMVERLKINQFYGAPTALRLLMKSSDDYVTKYDRSSLRTLGTVGEPINPKAWQWYYDVVGEGRCPIVDTWWQTETGGIMITPRPGPTTEGYKGGAAMRPFYGVDVKLLDPITKVPVEGNDVVGNLCIAQPTPGMARTVYGDHERYIKTYFSDYPGYYFSGDGGWRDPDGDIWLTGRVDDVMNVSGHRIGTAEVEGVLVDHLAVAESAVVSKPHDIKGECIFAFVILKDGVTEVPAKLIADMNGMVSETIGKFAKPENIILCPNLPKTRSGKIMRRILVKLAQGEDDIEKFGDISTLAEPAVVITLIDLVKESKK